MPGPCWPGMPGTRPALELEAEGAEKQALLVQDGRTHAGGKGVSRRELYGVAVSLGSWGSTLSPALIPCCCALHRAWSPRAQALRFLQTAAWSLWVGRGLGASELQVSTLPSSGALLVRGRGSRGLASHHGCTPLQLRGSSPCLAQAGPPPTTKPSLAASPSLSFLTAHSGSSFSWKGAGRGQQLCEPVGPTGQCLLSLDVDTSLWRLEGVSTEPFPGP